VAFVLDELKEKNNAKISLDNDSIITAKYEEEKVIVKNENGDTLPGFYTMWFSWANHNLPEGVNKQADGKVWGL
jgi:hypothetical protein